jgi:hypothetical protein
MSKWKWSVVSGNPVQVIECTLISFDFSDYKPNTSFRALSVVYMWLVFFDVDQEHDVGQYLTEYLKCDNKI